MATHAPAGRHVDLRALVGSGDRIMLATLPVLVAGVLANALIPAPFRVGGPPIVLRVVAAVLLGVGVVGWAWSVLLILMRVPRGELITTGPFAIVRHPLYTAVSLLVLPWLGVLCNSWLGIVVGFTTYAASRRFAPAEEANLARTFGARWEEYRRSVLIGRL